MSLIFLRKSIALLFLACSLTWLKWVLKTKKTWLSLRLLSLTQVTMRGNCVSQLMLPGILGVSDSQK